MRDAPFPPRGAAGCRAVPAALAAALLIAACAAPPPAAAPAAAPELARPAAVAGATRYVFRAERCDVRFIVRRAGRLAALGHDHVVRARTVRGELFLAPDVRRSTFAVSLPVADFEVDPAAARADEGEAFAKPPPPEAIAGTRKNMLGDKVLAAARYPTVDVRSVGMVGPAWAPDVTIAVTLRGAIRELTVPVAVEYGEGRLVATAVFDIRQSDFGMRPLAVLGGALQVADTLRVRMRLVAERG